MDNMKTQLDADIQALTADYVEYQKQQYERTQQQGASLLTKYAKDGEWEKFISYALLHWEVLPIAFSFYDDIPDDMKYEFCTGAYTHHGDSVPGVRKAVRNALKYGRPKLPEDIVSADEVVVFRAGEEPIEKAKYRISWTTDINVALFFLNRGRLIGRHASHLYTGKIKPEKIIAYTDDRKEREIMQYRNVYAIQEITGQHMESLAERKVKQ